MNEILEYIIDDHTIIFIEAEKKQEGLGIEKSGNITNSKYKFNEAIKVITPIANSVIDKIKNIKNKPSEIKISFGLKFNANAGVILASVSSEANLSIEIKWDRSNEL